MGNQTSEHEKTDHIKHNLIKDVTIKTELKKHKFFTKEEKEKVSNRFEKYGYKFRFN